MHKRAICLQADGSIQHYLFQINRLDDWRADLEGYSHRRSSDIIGDRGKFVFLAGRNSKINDDIIELGDEVRDRLNIWMKFGIREFVGVQCQLIGVK